MADTSERIIAPEAAGDDKTLDVTLRPKKIAEFIGQDNIKKNLRIFLSAAQGRKEPIEHVLLYGTRGLGKTSLSRYWRSRNGRAYHHHIRPGYCQSRRFDRDIDQFGARRHPLH